MYEYVAMATSRNQLYGAVLGDARGVHNIIGGFKSFNAAYRLYNNINTVYRPAASRGALRSPSRKTDSAELFGCNLLYADMMGQEASSASGRLLILTD